MPPFTSLARHHLSPGEWVEHDDFAILEDYVTGILRNEMGQTSELPDVESMDYDQIRPCLPLTQVSML